MRITTQMLNESARKAGVPVNQSSLLNYIKGKKSTAINELLQKNNKSSRTNAVQKDFYETMEKSAEALRDSAEALTSEEDNLFARARESGKTGEIKKQVKSFIAGFNDTLKKLSGSGSALDAYYKKMLQQAVAEDKKGLSGIGISVDKNGYLQMDESQFDGADMDALEKALGKNSSIMPKVEFIAGRAADNAKSNLAGMSSQYSAAGRNTSSYLSNKYDFWG